MNETHFGARDLSLAYGKKRIIEALNIDIPIGYITALIGRNGSGKSTLLKAMARLIQPHGGAVYINGQSIHAMPTREVSRRLAILPQHPQSPEGLTVEELVWHGRFPHQSVWGGKRKEDRQIVQWAMEMTGVSEWADRPLSSLSGGQRQRAWIAMALAQKTPLLLLDEPTTYLDLAYQIEVLDLLKRLNETEGITVVMVLHDINQAARYAHQLIALRDGKVVAQGTPSSVITPETLESVFGIQARVIADPVTGHPMCIPLSSASRKKMKQPVALGQ
ncbi:iron-dicitrate ABC transporter ATP-binding protein [Polycladomyces abyssicola]|uniref:Iron-dicitrate ABC transporter ATP-binding protein n=1 Tax=Polycladomyces abyssicola TaxID=1125966 RepID=A0A8D5ZP47_9BACL|nr:ABC transporter ATP-binding protein [Polycladomyces abyssicola]BCU81978.1 iron-dicitrate ABC transporter ATP-binding protein [Polycladomyces abyssicola]